MYDKIILKKFANCLKLCKVIIIFFRTILIFLYTNVKMEQLRRQSAQPESLEKFLGTENTIFDLENKNIYRGFKQKFRSRKFPFRLRKDRNSRKNTKVIER